jgi:hypothetical protein
MWRIGQLVLDSLFRETNEAPFPWTKDSNLQRQFIEAYRVSIQRGLTPRDALAVAMALGTVNKGSLLAPDLAKRARPVSH